MSHEVVGDPAACVLDGLTIVRGDLVKVFGWYENAQRTVDLVDMIVAPFQTVESRPAPVARDLHTGDAGLEGTFGSGHGKNQRRV